MRVRLSRCRSFRGFCRANPICITSQRLRRLCGVTVRRGTERERERDCSRLNGIGIICCIGNTVTQSAATSSSEQFQHSHSPHGNIINSTSTLFVRVSGLLTIAACSERIAFFPSICLSFCEISELASFSRPDEHGT